MVADSATRLLKLIVTAARWLVLFCLLTSWVSAIIATQLSTAYQYARAGGTMMGEIRQELSDELKQSSAPLTVTIDPEFSGGGGNTANLSAFEQYIAYMPQFLAGFGAVAAAPVVLAVLFWAVYLHAILVRAGQRRPVWTFVMPMAGLCVWFFFPLTLWSVWLATAIPWLSNATSAWTVAIGAKLVGCSLVAVILKRNASVEASFSLPALFIPTLVQYLAEFPVIG